MALFRYIQIPNGYKRIGRGIVMYWAGNDVTFAVDLEIQDATTDLATEIAHSIEKIWNDVFDDGYSVSTKVSVLCKTTAINDPNRTQIYVTSSVAPSEVVNTPLLYYAYMNYHVHGPSGNSWTPAHEFGHLLGLRDRYHESVRSRMNAMYGRRRKIIPDPGWKGNIMAQGMGKLEKRNIQELFALHAFQMVNFIEDTPRIHWDPRTGRISMTR